MSRNLSILICLLLVGFGLAPMAYADPGGWFAEHIEKMLDDMKETEYQHRTEIDETTGSLKCDCSGFIGYSLRHHFPEAYISLKGIEAPWRKRPMAITYYETFIDAGKDKAGKGPWLRVRRIGDVRPGDILAWRKVEIEKGETSGHVLMIAGLPKREADGRIRIRVIDSTRKPHANDTRKDGALGVGAGDMWFTEGKDGAPIGFYVDERSKQSTANQVAVGRIVNAESPTVSPGGEWIGKAKSVAIRLAQKRSIDWRIIAEDGKVQPVPMSIIEARMNFVVENGKVVRVIRG